MSNFSLNFIERSRGFMDLDKLSTPINIIGAGAVGSAVAVNLSKMGFGNLSVWDYDLIEDVNIGCQRYFVKDVGRYKVEALREMVFDSSGFSIKVYPRKFEDKDHLLGITINCTDSMEARKQIYEALPNGSTYIDPRMSALIYNLFVVTKSSNDKYMDTWYTDDQAVREPCTMRSTVFAAEMLASRICYYVFRIIRGESVPMTTIWDGGNIKDNLLVLGGNDGKDLV